MLLVPSRAALCLPRAAVNNTRLASASPSPGSGLTTENTASEEMDEIKRALEFLTEEVAAVKMQQNSTLSLVEVVKALGIQNKRIEHLESCVVELEQYSRLNKVIITGLQVKPQSYARAVTADDGETNVEMQVLTEQQVVSFLQSKGIDLDDRSIEVCHPLTRRNAGDKQAILITFINRNHKNALLKEGRKLKGTDVYMKDFH